MLIHNADITGSLSVNGTGFNTGSFSGSFTGIVAGTTSTASYVEYNSVANKPALVSGSSQITYSGLTGIPSGIVSGSSQVTYSGLTGVPSGIVSGSSQVTYSGLTGVPSGIVSGSAQISDFGIFATTGSNGFNGSQSITGSLTVTGQVVAQTLNVQQVTSSIVYSSGSNIFGNTLANTQQFTGSVSITGSLNTSIAAFGSAATVFLTSDGGVIKSRTAAQTLSDIAALPLAGGTLTGALSGTSGAFSGGLTVTSASTIGMVVNSTNNASYHGYRIQNNGTDRALFETNANNGEIKIGSIPGDTNDHFPVIYSDGVAALTFGLGAAPSATFISSVTAGGGVNAGDSKFFNSVQLTDSLGGTCQGFLWTDAANTLKIGTGTVAGGNVKLTIASTGAATFSSTVETTGIKFPATQVSSADSNTLDDYEGGTWTPTINFGGTSGSSAGVTYTSQAGRYTKIGRVVCYVGEIVLSSKGSGTGIMRITGFPFTNGSERASLSFGNANSLSHTGFLQAYIEGTSTYTNTYSTSDAGTQTQITDTNASNTTHIQFSVVSQV